MTRVRDVVAGLKDPAYTGANRCLPCTAVNLFLAFVLALGVELAAILAGRGAVGLIAAEAAFGVAAAVIYFRGYLVPGMPVLTRRYLPERLLAAFGKAGPTDGFGGGEFDEDLDVEAVLLEAGALTERADGEDLRLTDEFRRAWRKRIAAVRDADASREALFDVLDVASGEIGFEEYGDAFPVFRDDRRVGRWESRPAFVADVAAAGVLRDRVDGWAAASVSQRGQLLNGLRLFLTTCPGCDGDLALRADTVESCCSTYDVAAVTCESCDARVFESRTAA